MKLFYFFLALYAVLACQSESEYNPSPDQVSTMSLEELRLPENALLGLEVGPGLKAQIFATEPLVRNPSNIDIDHRGRVWVVENVNYRPENNPDNEYQEGGDMVVILEDTDGDGRADDRKVFFHDTLVDGAMGIGVFGNQVYLSSSPHILILTDEDYDDTADKVDTLFTGMGSKQGDHTVHAVSFGPDGRLYFNYGNASPEMLSKDGAAVVDKMGNAVNNLGNPYRGGMVFRCEMDGNNLESLAHNFRNNYEVCVDSYGRMWQSDNDDDGNKSVRINYVMEYGNFGYRDELTGSSWQTSRSGWHPEIPSRHWHQNDPGVVPNLLITGSGSPCGITVYEGFLLPEVFRGQILHADAGPGAARAYPIENSGAGFTAREEPMLMRKSDPWYRPTDVSIAPDGSLFTSDWYDPGVGGHWAGDPRRGRIFRLTTAKADKYEIPTSHHDTPAEAVASLKSPNSATRYLAWTALRQFGKEATTSLEELWSSDISVLRARALWLMARLDVDYITTALADQDPLIRTTGVRAARQLYAEQLPAIIEPMLNDPSPKVRREIAIALREMHAGEVPAYWARLALQHNGQDRWYLEALGIGATGRWDACFRTWMKKIGDEWSNAAGNDIVWRSRAADAFGYLIQLLSRPDASAAEQARYLRATDFHKIEGKDDELVKLMNLDRIDKPAFQQQLLTHITPAYARASKVVIEAMTSLLPNLRGTSNYLDIVTKLGLKEEVPHVFQMALENPGHELGVRSAILVVEMDSWQRFEKAIKGNQKKAVIEVLSHISNGEGKELLRKIVADNSEDLSIRKKAVDALSLDWGWEARMIRLLEEDELHEELIAMAATRLLNAARPIDRALGLSYLDALPNGIPGKKLAPMKELLDQEGIANDGKVAFTSFCSTCHQVNNLGIEFGPDLSEIGNKMGKEGLFSSIIYPGAAVSHGFEGHHFELKDGTHHVGYILDEAQGRISLRVQSGLTQTFNNEDVLSRETLDKSLMTEGLAQTIGEQSLVDLVTYLSTLVNKENYVSNPFQGKINYEREN